MMNAVRNDLRVGLRTERVALALEFRAQRLVILDDAVVHDRKPVSRDVRVCIALARHAVRGPTSMRDAEGAVARCEVERILQRLNLANRSQAGQVMRIIDDGYTRRVITPILQPPQSFHEDGNDITLSDRPYNSTHTVQALVATRGQSLRPRNQCSVTWAPCRR